MDPIIFSTAGEPTSVVATCGRQLEVLGYTVTPGPDGWTGEAEVGSKVGRAIGGGFVRRMKVTYALTQGHQPGEWVLAIHPAMTGAAGGAIGMSKAKKEMASIAESVAGGLAQVGHIAPLA